MRWDRLDLLIDRVKGDLAEKGSVAIEGGRVKGMVRVCGGEVLIGVGMMWASGNLVCGCGS